MGQSIQNSTRTRRIIRREYSLLAAAVLMLALVSRSTRARIVFRRRATRLPAAFGCSGTTFQRHSAAPISRSIPDRRILRYHLPRHYVSTTTARSASLSSEESLLQGLNDAQIKAVTQPLASITRVVAGPGAGKTKVLTSRIAYILQNDPNRNVLAVTFTKKAAGEMQQRLDNLLEKPVEATTSTIAGTNIVVGTSTTTTSPLDRVTLGTFHSVCAKILRWNGKLLETLPSVVRDTVGTSTTNATTRLDGNFAIVDQSEQLRILRECEKELELKMDEIKPLTILNALGKIKAMLAAGEDPMKPPDRSPPSKAIREAIKYYSLYRQKILLQNALDFDDLILLTRELLTVHDDIRDHLRRRWPHLLVDEFQDTSRVQLDLVKLLSDTSLFVVGDADQSIYSWRGAHVESMSDFCHEFDDRLNGVETVYLMENYRSTTNIVNAAQKIISADIAASKQDDLRQDMKPMRGSGPTPRVLACADGKAEAGFVVQTIQDMLASGEYMPETAVAIIYRTNAQSRDLEEACVKANLPYVLRGASGSFYKRAEIKDCLCFLRLLANGRDEASLARAIKTPSRGIGDVALQEFKQYCAEVGDFYERNHPDQPVPTLLDVLISLSDSRDLVADVPPPTETMSKRALNRFTPFSEQMRNIKKSAHERNVADLLTDIVETLALKDHFDSISKSKAEFTDRWSNVVELRRAAERYNDDGASLKRANATDGEDAPGFVETPLGNFLDDVALVTDTADDVLDEDNAGEKRLVVSLMTIHASKGCEYDAVFLVGNEDGTLPTKQAIMEGEGSVALDEEKRLCYVAMTRAKTNLIMTWRREVSVFNGNNFSFVTAKRSRFLDLLVSKKAKTKKESTAKPAKKPGPPQHQRHSTSKSSLPASTLFSSRSPVRKTKNPNDSTISNRTPQLRNGTRRSSTSAAVLQNGARAPSETTASQREAPPRNNVAAPQSAPLRNGSAANHVSRPRSTGSPSSTASRRRETMDSTWFYPVGSSVIHKQMGPGQVLPPPQAVNGELLVRVQFQNGDRHDFPAEGTDLQLDLTS